MTGIRNGTNLNHYRYASLPHKGINLVRCLRNVLRIGRQAATSSLIFPHLFFSLVRRTCFRSERSSLPRLSLRDISRPLKQTCPPGWRLRRSAMMNSQFAQAYIAFYRRQPMRMWLSFSLSLGLVRSRDIRLSLVPPSCTRKKPLGIGRLIPRKRVHNPHGPYTHEC